MNLFDFRQKWNEDSVLAKKRKELLCASKITNSQKIKLNLLNIEFLKDVIAVSNDQRKINQSFREILRLKRSNTEIKKKIAFNKKIKSASKKPKIKRKR